MVILDATPLIYPSKVDALGLLEYTADENLVPEAVYAEVVTNGIEAGFTDARRIEQAVDRGLLTVQYVGESEFADRLRRNPNLSEADVAVITLAAKKDEVAVMDDRYARATAETEGVETIGTIAVVLNAVKKEALDPEEAIELLDGIIDAGWYCSTDLYTRIVKKIQSIADNGDTP